MKNDCLFCSIVDGEMPSYKLYEDDFFYVMLDRFPKCLGHTLILPKRHAMTVFDLTAEECARLMPLAQRVATAMREVLGYTGLNLLQNNGETAGQEIMHFHLHLIPRFAGDNMVIRMKTEDPAPKDFEEMAEKLCRLIS